MDCIELSLFRVTGGALAVKGPRFKQNEESYLPDIDGSADDRDFNGYDYDDYDDDYGYCRHGAHCRKKPKDTVTASRFRKCRHFERKLYEPDYFTRREICLCGWTPTPIEIFGIVLASFAGGVVATSLVVYFQAGLKKWALKTGIANKCCWVSVWRRLLHGRTGAIQLPIGSKNNAPRKPEQELE